MWVWVSGLFLVIVDLFFWGFFFFYWFFFFFFLWLDASVDLVAQWEVEGWVDDGGCLMMVAMWVVLGL